MFNLESTTDKPPHKIFCPEMTNPRNLRTTICNNDLRLFSTIPHVNTDTVRIHGSLHMHPQLPSLFLFRVLLLEKIHFPLPITEATCGGCCAPLDPRGLHRAALGLEATLVEPMLARVFPRIGAVQRVLERYQCGSVGNR